MSDKLKNEKQDLNHLYDQAFSRGKIGIEHAQNTLPIMIAAREEQQHSLNLIDSLVDKILGLAKLLITVSVPALIALYSLKNDEFNSSQYIILSLFTFFLGLVLFVIGFMYKLKYLPTYLEGSSARLNVYTEWIKTTLLHARNEDLKLDGKKDNQNRKSRP